MLKNAQKQTLQNMTLNLQVDVAERTISGAHQRAKGDILRGVRAQVDGIVKSAVTGRRLVENGDSVGDDIDAVLARRKAKVLPDPPNAVNHAVVNPEGRVTGGEEDITT